jgi:tetratricopeptide (TPR) repeat protein
MKHKFNLKSVAVLLLVSSITGCSTFTGDKGLFSSRSNSKNTSSEEVNRTQVLLQAGTDYLQKGDLEKAQSVFNSGLKFDLNNAALHFFNALTYQLKFEKGDSDSFSLAEAGYKTSLGLDPTLDPAYLQLGRLYLSSKQYNDAKKAFALAVDLNPKKNQEALINLAQASIFSGDTSTAVWATKKLDEQNWQDARLFRTKAYLAALAKQPAMASDMLARYTALEKDKRETRYVTSRIDQLLATKTSFQNQGFNSKSNDILLAQANTAEKATDAAPEPTLEKTVAAPASTGNWFRCDTRPQPVVETGTAPMLPATPLPISEENAYPVTLPAPCPGEKPPAGIIEVTLIRTEETIVKNFGVNLMDGLYLGRSLTTDAVGNITNYASFYNSAGGVPTAFGAASTSGFLAYSMNIANALYTKNEVIARPTLAVMDRMPSVFFSGGTISIKVSGAAGSTSTLVDKSTGVVLSVTPTFIENDEVLLNIRASRTFVEDNGNNSNIALGSSEKTLWCCTASLPSTILKRSLMSSI